MRFGDAALPKARASLSMELWVRLRTDRNYCVGSLREAIYERADVVDLAASRPLALELLFAGGGLVVWR